MPVSNGVPVWEREVEATAKTQTPSGVKKKREREVGRVRDRDSEKHFPNIARGALTPDLDRIHTELHSQQCRVRLNSHSTVLKVISHNTVLEFSLTQLLDIHCGAGQVQLSVGGIASAQQLQVTAYHSVLYNALPSPVCSVMDILNLWNDDPEEILLDLGFGCDVPDLSGRIPARFINHQSQARGINLQVFLEAQKNRLDLENPDVSNRFRQLEVLQQVTTAFSSLVGSSSSSPFPLRSQQGKDLPPEARERRRRMGMLFRRASKKSLSQIHNHKTQNLTTPAVTTPPCAAPESLQPPASLEDKKVPLKRVKPGLLDTVCLSPLAEEQGAGSDPQPQPHVASLIAHEGALRPWPLKEGQPLTVSTVLQRKKSARQARESFEMEEIHSFDECSVTGNFTGGAENSVRGVIRTNSCQSDSSGFLEEPFIPSLSQQASPGPDLIKALSVLSGGSNDSQSSERKDVPYMTDSKRTLLPSILPLDTSTPFRAVQSWADLQIQRNTLTKKLSHGALHTGPNEVTVSTSASETTQRHALIFSSSPSFPLLSNDWQSHDCLPGMDRNYCTVSVSVDKGLWPDEEEEVDRNENEDEKLWEGNQTATMACCCSCDHQCTCCTQKSYNKQHTLGNIPYSLNELEEMMLCLQQFRSVLSNMEEQLSEDQAAVYSSLSDQDREKIRDIEELRRTVKQEAGELEMQLNELAHHYDDSLKMKMHRLLDEQSLLCSQLRVFLPGTVPTSLSRAPNRTVATQCCLLPWIPPAHIQSGQVSSWSKVNVDPARQSPPGSESTCEGLGCSPTKTDKLDIVGFLQRLKESLRPSVNIDSLE
ncbi:uncharacterized protein itprid1 [Enoplosus armatus]|uniref:uncharacterized protein itprid1 n=1 Tax=Enoplosus armatus TaxID=215367 RepID=UPI003991B772